MSTIESASFTLVAAGSIHQAVTTIYHTPTLISALLMAPLILIGPHYESIRDNALFLLFYVPPACSNYRQYEMPDCNGFLNIKNIILGEYYYHSSLASFAFIFTLWLPF